MRTSPDLTEKIFVPPLGSKARCILTVFYPPPMLWMRWHLCCAEVWPQDEPIPKSCNLHPYQITHLGAVFHNLGDFLLKPLVHLLHLWSGSLVGHLQQAQPLRASSEIN